MQAMGLSTTGSVSYGAAEEKLKDVVIKVMSSLYNYSFVISKVTLQLKSETRFLSISVLLCVCFSV